MAEAFNPAASLLSAFPAPEVETDEEEQQVVEQPEVQKPEEYDPTAILDELPDPDAAETQRQLSPPELPDEDDQLTFTELASDADYMDMLREYQEDRFGDEGKQGEDESNEDYLKRFLSHTREFEWNSIDLGSQLDWVRTANDEQRIKFGYLYSQLDRLPSFYEEGGGSTVTAIRDFGKSLLTDPLNYIGLGAGKAATFIGTRAITQAFKQGGKKLALEEAAKYSAKRMLGTGAGRIAAGGIAVEAGAAAVQDLKLQDLAMETQMYGEDTPEEYSYTGAALTGLLGLGGGAIGTKLAGGLGGQRMYISAKQARIKQRRIRLDMLRREKGFAEEAGQRVLEATKDGNQVATGIFDTDNGRKVLDQLGELPEGADLAAEAQFRTELMQRVGRVVTNVVEDLAESGQLGSMIDVDTKASEVIGKIVSDSLKQVEGKGAKEIREQTQKMLLGDETGKAGILDKIEIDGVLLESAISKAGLTTKQFVDAMGASYSDAGKYLQTASKVGKVMKELRGTDKELADALMKYTDADQIVGPIGKGGAFLRRLDRERRALMVTQVATTVRNIATAASRLTMESAANLMESAIYHIGKGSDASMTGNIPRGARSSYKDIIRDAFGSLNRLRYVTETADLTDALLRHNPQLASRIDKTLQEVSADESLSYLTRKLNGLNVAQDLIFRRAIFTDTIEKRMRRAGIITDTPVRSGQYKNLEEFVAAGKSLPPKFLSDAVEEALDFTFSRMPKPGSGKAGDTVGYWLIKANESIGPAPLPVGTAAFPFARFMVNALQFQFAYSPANLAGSIYKYGLAKNTQRLAAAAKAAGDVDLATKQGRAAQAALDKARADFSKGVVGTAALIAAIHHRANNQDVKWYEYKSDDGTTGDLRPFFPLTPYLALADVFVKWANDKPINGKEFLEGFTGAQFRTGASSYIIENFAEAIRGEDKSGEKFGELAGQYVGELFGGYLTPLRVIRDIEAAYDTEAAYVRDARQTEGVGGDERFFSAVKNTIAKDIPGLSKDLPILESPTREAPVVRMSPLTGQLTGVRKEAERNPAEQELVRLGIQNWEVVPSTGDKKADAFVKKYMGKEVERDLIAYVQSDAYQSKSEVQKRAAMNNRLKFYRARATQLGKIEATQVAEKSYTPFDRAQFGKLSKIQRKLADEYYMEKYDGKDVIEMQEMEPDKNHLKKAIAIGRVLSRGTG